MTTLTKNKLEHDALGYTELKPGDKVMAQHTWDKVIEAAEVVEIAFKPTPKAFSEEVMPVGSVLVKWVEGNTSVQDWVKPDGIHRDMDAAAQSGWAHGIALFEHKRSAQDVNRIFVQVLFNSRAIAIARQQVADSTRDYLREYERCMLEVKLLKTHSGVTNAVGSILLYSGAGTLLGAAMILYGSFEGIAMEYVEQIKQDEAANNLKNIMAEDVEKSDVLMKAMVEFGQLCETVALRHVVTTATAAYMIWASNAMGAFGKVNLGKKGYDLYTAVQDAVQIALKYEAAESTYRLFLVAKMTEALGENAVASFGRFFARCSKLATDHAGKIFVVGMAFTGYYIYNTWAKIDPTLKVIKETIKNLEVGAEEVKKLFQSMQSMDISRNEPANAAALEDSDALIIGDVANGIQAWGH